MKIKILLFLFFVFFILSCKKDDGTTYIMPLNEISACGSNDPLNELKWLNQLAQKAIDDKTGNYIGSIWIITHENSDLIVTDMALGSGGIYLYLFDCQGNKIANLEGLDPNELTTRLKNSNMIFSTGE